jgi:hypothetical protein
MCKPGSHFSKSILTLSPACGRKRSKADALSGRLHSAQAAWFMSLRLSTGVNFQQLKRQVK